MTSAGENCVSAPAALKQSSSLLPSIRIDRSGSVPKKETHPRRLGVVFGKRGVHVIFSLLQWRAALLRERWEFGESFVLTELLFSL